MKRLTRFDMFTIYIIVIISVSIALSTIALANYMQYKSNSEKSIQQMQKQIDENDAFIKEMREFMQKLNAGDFEATSYAPSAVDPKIIPLGSKMWVEGYGFGIAGETGGAIIGNRLDVFANTRVEAMEWGRKKVMVIWLKA